VPIKLCVTLMRGSTKRLPKNKRDGNEATQRMPGFVRRSDKQTNAASKLHWTLIKPRRNGTLASQPSDKLPTTLKGQTTHGNPLVLQAPLERFGDEFGSRVDRARPAARSAIMTDLHIRFLRLVARRIQRELDDYDAVGNSGDAASKSRREHLKWLVIRARARVTEAEARPRYHGMV
jgi:hypothetical protein